MPFPFSPAIHWILRLGCAMCFIGHGAFGIITKEAWVPYFAALGFPEGIAYRLMPIVGTVDILMGLSVLLSPCRAVLLYMTSWALFTALLRPLAGEAFWETLERAGNYGIPFAFLVLCGWPRSWREWFEPIGPRHTPGPDAKPGRVALVLRATTALLLIGHGGFGAFMNKETLAEHYASAGLESLPLGALVQGIGWFELLLGVLVLAAPFAPLLIFVFVWKVATETLYPVSGAPIWEFIERGGSYAAPLALFFIVHKPAEPAPVEAARASAEGAVT